MIANEGTRNAREAIILWGPVFVSVIVLVLMVAGWAGHGPLAL